MPKRKVMAGAAAGAATVVLAWLLKDFAHLDMPAEVSSALTVLFSFVVSYLVPEAD